MIQANFDLGGVITFIINNILYMLESLDNIEFLGTTMLKFSLTLMILGILIPVIFTIARGMTIKNAPRQERSARRGK